MSMYWFRSHTSPESRQLQLLVLASRPACPSVCSRKKSRQSCATRSIAARAASAEDGRATLTTTPPPVPKSYGRSPLSPVPTKTNSPVDKKKTPFSLPRPTNISHIQNLQTPSSSMVLWRIWFGAKIIEVLETGSSLAIERDHVFCWEVPLFSDRVGLSTNSDTQGGHLPVFPNFCFQDIGSTTNYLNRPTPISLCKLTVSSGSRAGSHCNTDKAFYVVCLRRIEKRGNTPVFRYSFSRGTESSCYRIDQQQPFSLGPRGVYFAAPLYPKASSPSAILGDSNLFFSQADHAHPRP